MYRRIVVPLDGSELAERALAEAERLARLTGAPLRVLRVIDSAALHGIAGYGLAIEAAALAQVLEAERNATRDYLARIEGEIAERGLAVSTETRFGPAAREIVAALQPGDVVVMASHGRGGVVRWFLGSVAEEVARRSPVPVLLVRAEPGQSAAGGTPQAAAVADGR